MIVVTSGCQHTVIDKHEYLANAGDILLYPPGNAHMEWAESGQQFSSYHFGFIWRGAPATLPLFINDRMGRVRLLAEWLHAEKLSTSSRDPSISQAIFTALLSQFVRLWLYHDDELVEKIRRHVTAKMSEALDLEGLAAVAGMSKFHFTRRYSKLTGRTPMEDARHIRIERARDMILTSSMPLKDIAEAVGLANVYHMSRLFKRQLGVTPGSLRRRG